MKPRRINIICDYASLYGGNFIPSIFGLAKSLKEKGCFIMFTFPSPAKERNWAKYLMQEGMQLNFISFSKSFEKEIKHLNKKYEINLIYTHFKSGLRMKLLYPFSKKVKIVVHEHSDFTAGKKINWLTRFKNFVEHKILRKDAQYIFVSSSMKEKHKGKNYFYVPNALSLNRIPCQKLDIDALKKEYAISSCDTVFLTFAWSPYVKGTDIAVEAFQKANVENKNAKLLVIHGRDDGYNKCATFLKNQIGEDFLNDDSIILLPPLEDVFSYYHLADVFISSSRSEGFSYSLLESLFFNLKAISSDIAGVQWASKYQNVIFFQSENVDECSKVIKSLIGFKKNLKQNDEIAMEYSINKWLDTVGDILLK